MKIIHKLVRNSEGNMTTFCGERPKGSELVSNSWANVTCEGCHRGCILPHSVGEVKRE